MDNETRDTPDAQQKAFRDHLQRASEIVNGWPPWKKAVVGQGTEDQPSPEHANHSTECNNNNNNHSGGNGKG